MFFCSRGRPSLLGNQRRITNTTRLVCCSRFRQSTAQPGQPSSNERIIVTHDGKFHCDEVLACYLLKYHTSRYKNATIVRSREPHILSAADILVDVGHEYNVITNRFDHHQSSFNMKFHAKASTKMSSAGLIYKHFGPEIIRNILAQETETTETETENENENGNESQSEITIDDALIEYLHQKLYVSFMEEIDAVDNGVSSSSSKFNANSNADSNTDATMNNGITAKERVMAKEAKKEKENENESESEFNNTDYKYRVTTTLSQRISMLNLAWNWNETGKVSNADDISRAQQRSFEDAMLVAGLEFKHRVLYLFKHWLPARSIVKDAIENRFSVHESGKILKLDTVCPWIEHLFELFHEQQIANFTSPSSLPLYMLSEDTGPSGGWRVRCTPWHVSAFECMQLLPIEWRGKINEELCHLTGVSNCVFVHQSGFIGGNKTYAGALEMAVQSMEYGRSTKSVELII